MKVMIIFTALALVVGLCAIPVNAQGPPLPHAFYGAVEIDGSPAPVGTTVEARGEGVITGEGNPITVGPEAGMYGGPGSLDPKLVAQGDIEEGTPLTFYVDGVEAETDPATVAWHSGEVTELNLTVTMPVVPTVITDTATGIVNTSATLNGILIDLGDASSIELLFEWGITTDYGNQTNIKTMTSTGSFSATLDGLTANTTYLFRAKAVGEGTSYGSTKTFTTTAGDIGNTTPPIISDISVSPSEVNIGETVTIRFSVTNTGSTDASCTVTLNINGTVEATKEVTLGAGASEEVTFTTAKDVAGTYSVTVNGLSGSFTVKEMPVLPPAAPPEEAPGVKPPLNWTLIGGIIAGVVIVGLLIFFLARRRAY